MPVQITSWTYPTVFYVLFFAWPLAVPAVFLLEPKLEPSVLDWVFAMTQFALVVGSFVLIQWRCSSWAITYWQAIGAKSMGLESGCVNITIVYMLPMLFLYHIKFFCIAAASLFLGREMAQVATLDMVKNKLDRRYPYAKVRQLLKDGKMPGPDLFSRFDRVEQQKQVKAVRGDDAADALADAFEQMEQDHHRE